MVDGVDVRRADPARGTRRIAVVPQEPVIFAASVWENVRYGRADARRGRCGKPARRRTRPSSRPAAAGFDTTLGERGVKLSGGERQRLAIARGARAPVDPAAARATSALDAQSGKRHGAARARAPMAGRTTLIIAHRLATVIGADRIVVPTAACVAIAEAHARVAGARRSVVSAAGVAPVRASTGGEAYATADTA
jgi:ATP-binding cassette subfamily B protein